MPLQLPPQQQPQQLLRQQQQQQDVQQQQPPHAQLPLVFLLWLIQVGTNMV